MIALEQNIENCTSRLQDFSKSQQSNLIRCFFKTYYSSIFLFFCLGASLESTTTEGVLAVGTTREVGEDISGLEWGMKQGFGIRLAEMSEKTSCGTRSSTALPRLHRPRKQHSTGSARHGRRQAPGCRGRASRRAWRARAASCG